MKETNAGLWITLFVTLVFVCGLSIGIAVSVLLGSRTDGGGVRGQLRPAGPLGASPAVVSERILNRLERETDLRPEQRDRLEALFAERENRFLEFNRDMRRRFESEQARLRADIASILTPEQMGIFDAARRPARGGMRPNGPGRPRSRER